MKHWEKARLKANTTTMKEGRKEGWMDGLIDGWMLSVPSCIVLKSDMERMIQREFLLMSFALVNL
jgi:hypothetical protein